MAPLACVPTTAGSGSDVSHRTLIRDADSWRVRECISPTLRPDHAVVDPAFAMSCSAEVTARSGAIALSNAVEAVLGIDFHQLHEPVEGLPFEGNNPLSDLLGMRSAELIREHLVTTFESPTDIKSRTFMCLGASLAGAAVANSGYGMVTAITLATMNAHSTLSMGDIVLIVLPEVVRMFGRYSPERVLRIAATLVPEFAAQRPAVDQVEDAAEVVASCCRQLRHTLGLPTCLADLGIVADDIPRIASESVQNTLAATMTPGQVSVDAVIDLLQRCLGNAAGG